MKGLTFNDSAIVALLLTIAGAVIFFSVSMFTSSTVALRLVVTLLGGAYAFYLVMRSEERSGYLLLVMVWASVESLLWSVYPGLAVFFTTNIALLWLTRALYHCSGPLCAGLDVLLHGLAFGLAAFAGSQTNSFFVSVWCFFLVLALFAWLPNGVPTASHKDREHRQRSSRSFGDALKAAEGAVEKIARA